MPSVAVVAAIIIVGKLELKRVTNSRYTRLSFNTIQVFFYFCLKTGFLEIHISCLQFDKNHHNVIMLFRPATIPI